MERSCDTSSSTSPDERASDERQSTRNDAGSTYPASAADACGASDGDAGESNGARQSATGIDRDQPTEKPSKDPPASAPRMPAPQSASGAGSADAEDGTGQPADDVEAALGHDDDGGAISPPVDPSVEIDRDGGPYCEPRQDELGISSTNVGLDDLPPPPAMSGSTLDTASLTPDTVLDAAVDPRSVAGADESASDSSLRGGHGSQSGDEAGATGDIGAPADIDADAIDADADADAETDVD
ncbi:MAG: hypothetical protein ACOC0P_04200, partial [Planctomycetota bacterium]